MQIRMEDQVVLQGEEGEEFQITVKEVRSATSIVSTDEKVYDLKRYTVVSVNLHPMIQELEANVEKEVAEAEAAAAALVEAEAVAVKEKAEAEAAVALAAKEIAEADAAAIVVEEARLALVKEQEEAAAAKAELDAALDTSADDESK